MNVAVRPIIPILIVVTISAGQLLFKTSANMIRANGGQLSTPIIMTIGVSLLIYAAATLAWIWVLQTSSLSGVYPVMALSFVLVPLGSWIVFGERLSATYVVGTLLLLTGLALIFSSQIRE